MIRKLAWLFMIVGGAILAYNGYQWWQQMNIGVNDPQLATSISDDWNDTAKAPTLKQGDKSIPDTPLQEGQVGELYIPRLGAILPIVGGVDEDSLEKGVGMYDGHGTVKPGQTGHVVLSGHRDTVFRKVGQLQDGDKLYVKYNKKTYTYQIRKSWVTHAEDRTVIVPSKDPVLSLTTCYPFNYVGAAPDRYIIRAELVEIKDS
ncbi:class D sortase [Hazenella coriacea]|uniref:Sortase A n=1 Tax=Hazenella coriacea TaxID=1179467 RepID=A0A4R3L802_9BACL|nr:class D sortase [Hazenella coriacea]TCS95682.1 sortase A [Hazenella coriacea]